MPENLLELSVKLKWAAMSCDAWQFRVVVAVSQLHLLMMMPGHIRSPILPLSLSLCHTGCLTASLDLCLVTLACGKHFSLMVC